MRWIIAACIAICLLCTLDVQGKDNLTSSNGSRNSNQSFNLSQIGNDEEIDAAKWTLWGDNAVRGGRYYTHAIFLYDKAISLDPNFIEAWNNKGVALYKMKRYKDALTCFNKTIEIDPKNSIAWSNKGETLHRLGWTSESISCLNRSLDLDLKNAVEQIKPAYILLEYLYSYLLIQDVNAMTINQLQSTPLNKFAGGA